MISPLPSFIFNLPNTLTLARVFLAPFLYISIRSSSWILAAIILVICALTDFADGFLARRWAQESSWGALADPVADKVLSTALLLGLAFERKIPLWMAGVVCFRDMLLMMGGAYCLYRGISLDLSPTFLGKCHTAILLCLGIFFCISQSFQIDIRFSYLFLCILLMSLLSGLIYVRRFF